jgi:16S rRNA processing protein RimM
MDTKFIVIGEVARVHGLKGEFSVIWHADSPSLLDALPAVYLKLPDMDRPKRFGVRARREHQGRILLWLDKVDGRDAAEAWRGAELLAKAEDLPGLDDDEVYLHDLLDAEALLPDGERLGRITAVTAEPTEVWTIETDDGKEVLFPVAEEFVVSMDLVAGQVVIEPPPGLLELYLEAEPSPKAGRRLRRRTARRRNKTDNK